MTELKPENFEVAADRDGEMSLRCALYGEGCWWDADIRDGRPDADLGSLLEVAREHIRTAHVTVIEGEFIQQLRRIADRSLLGMLPSADDVDALRRADRQDRERGSE